MNSAILVAAGQGTRMGPGVDKLFLELAGRPVVLHAWQTFDQTEAIDELILVIREDSQPAFDQLAARFQPSKPYRLVPGGKERQDSVWNGLQATSPAATLVAIHDGARPCVTPDLITATLAAAAETGAAVAAQRVTDTIKESTDDRTVARHLDRSKLWAVQTPQCFQRQILQRALAVVRDKGLILTDDTAACECINQPVRLVECHTHNPKVTRPADLPYIESLLNRP